ncbi:PhaM family polyhydroxyalkanoate granule multifunctional regulatory protein [Variovorax ginsengisoli]|uniref:Transcriptional regulator n=1 Tax=Variovorax ginsengisoli TaxID=363844 RepID=A0ABT9SCV3_9BURK|nr:PhaM family polyhydroxyalkanoate granule multifunctional regulatory protein [Variovorax ginsengisoli]MDP9901232.1 hypothetical protein [Variovorax ginsengisoli]
MSATTPSFDFSQFVPGFDFLKKLATTHASGATGGAVPGMPSLSNWVAPTLSVEEVDKRIQELKTVQYWLEQNGHALKATIQALEVQKMTLSTLRGMNVRMEDLASAFTRTAAAAAPSPTASAAAAPAPFGAAFFSSAPSPSASATPATASHEAPDAQKPDDANAADDAQAAADAPAAAAAPGAEGAGVVDPLQWWGALTQQFQQIASSALKDAAHLQMPVMPSAATGAATGKAATSAKAVKSAKSPVAGKTAAVPSRKKPAVRSAPAKAPRKKAAGKTPAARAPAKGR